MVTVCIGNALSPHGIARVANEARYRCARISRALDARYTRDAVVGQERSLRWATAIFHADGRTQDVRGIRDVATASTTGARRAAALVGLVTEAFTTCKQSLVMTVYKYIKSWRQKSCIELRYKPMYILCKTFGVNCIYIYTYITTQEHKTVSNK